MGNFAENLNLGNRVRPPLYYWIVFQTSHAACYKNLIDLMLIVSSRNKCAIHLYS